MRTEETNHRNKAMGQRLKQLRTDNGLPLRELAKRSGIDNSKIAKIERGKVNITYTMLLDLFAGLSIHPQLFFDFDYEGGQIPRVIREFVAEKKEPQKGVHYKFWALNEFFDAFTAGQPISEDGKEKIAKVLERRDIFPGIDRKQHRELCNGLYFTDSGALGLYFGEKTLGPPIGFVPDGELFLDWRRYTGHKAGQIFFSAERISIIYSITYKNLKILQRDEELKVPIDRIIRDSGAMLKKRSRVLRMKIPGRRISFLLKEEPAWVRKMSLRLLGSYLDVSTQTVHKARYKYFKGEGLELTHQMAE